MGFDIGNISYVRFNVVGEHARLPDAETLDKFAALALREGSETTSEIDYGWCGPRHVLDADFSVGNLVYNDCVHVGLRVDTNRVPASLKRAYVSSEQSAAAATNPSGLASKRQKKDAKDAAKKKIEEDLASGKFRRSKIINVLWDLPNHTLYAAAGGTTGEQLVELMERTFNLTLEPITSSVLALAELESKGLRRDFEDLTPTRFAAIAGDPPAEYPWTAKGDQAKDFLGNEFLVWLWDATHAAGGEIFVPGTNSMTVMFHRGMELDCVYGQSGRITARFEVPTEMPEVLDAMRAGKVPRRAGLTMAADGQLYTFTLGAESLSIAGLKLPDVDKADSARVLFEERIPLLRDFGKAIDNLYRDFVSSRTCDAWATTRERIQRRIAGKAVQA